MIGLDTNVVLRYLLRDDPRQTALVADLIENQLSTEERGFISLVVTAEIVWNLISNYDFTRDEVIGALDRLLSIHSLQLQSDTEISEAVEIMRRNPASFPDALINALAKAEGCTTTYTFDRKASRLPGFTLLS